jgi:predicted dehydrogenase
MELNGPHVLDTILWLVDAVPTRVYARSRRLRDHWQGDDEVVLVIDFADGSMATGYISLSTRPAVNDRWITGPAGSLKLTDDRNLWVDGVPVVEEPVTPYLDGDVSFERQFREFMDAVRTGREPVAAAREVRPLAVVMEAAERSQRTGEPIELSQDALPATGTTVA